MTVHIVPSYPADVRRPYLALVAFVAVTVAVPALARCASTDPCDDGDLCNGQETYDSATGACVAGVPPNCDDNDPCTFDTCLPATGCMSRPVPNYLACSVTPLFGRLATIQETIVAATPRALGGASVARRLRRRVADAIAALQAVVHDPRNARRFFRRIAIDEQALYRLALNGRMDPSLRDTLREEILALFRCPCGEPAVGYCPLLCLPLR